MSDEEEARRNEQKINDLYERAKKLSREGVRSPAVLGRLSVLADEMLKKAQEGTLTPDELLGFEKELDRAKEIEEGADLK